MEHDRRLMSKCSYPHIYFRVFIIFFMGKSMTYFCFLSVVLITFSFRGYFQIRIGLVKLPNCQIFTLKFIFRTDIIPICINSWDKILIIIFLKFQYRKRGGIIININKHTANWCRMIFFKKVFCRIPEIPQDQLCTFQMFF